jgi:hypothetical protein
LLAAVLPAATLLASVPDNWWPSQEYPQRTWAQSEHAYYGAMERFEAYIQSRYLVRPTPTLRAPAPHIGAFDNNPFMSYMRMSGTRDNLRLVFSDKPDTYDFAGQGGLFDSIPIYYPPRDLDARYYATNLWGAFAGSMWTPPYITMSNALEGSGVPYAWLQPRPGISLATSDVPRTALSTRPLGFRHMHVVTNMDYAWSTATRPFDDLLRPVYLGTATQTFAVIQSPTESVAFDLVHVTSSVSSLNPDMGGLTGPDLPLGLAPPAWFFTTAAAFDDYGTNWIRHYSLERDGVLTNLVGSADALQVQVNRRMLPVFDCPGIIASEASLVPSESTDVGIFVASWRNSTNPGYRVYSSGWQRLADCPGLQVDPFDGVTRLATPKAEYKIRWHPTPAYADGYIVACNFFVGDVISPSLLDFQVITGVTNTTATVQVRNAPPGGFDTNNFIRETAEISVLDHTNRLYANLPGVLLGLFAGLPAPPSYDPAYFDLTRIFDGYILNLRFQHRQKATVIAPPLGWWLDRWGYTSWDTELGGRTFTGLATNEFVQLYEHSMDASSTLYGVQPRSYKVRSYALQPFTPNPRDVPTSIDDVYADWWVMVDTNFALVPVKPLNLVSYRGKLDDWVELWDKDAKGVRYVRTMPSETGPWFPVTVESAKTFSVLPIGEACYYNPFAEVTNTLVTFETNGLKVTSILSWDGAAVSYAASTNYATIDMGAYTVTNTTIVLQTTTNYKLTAVATTEPFSTTYYQEEVETYCDYDNLVSNAVPRVQNWFSAVWTNQIYYTNSVFAAVTNYTVLTNGANVWTNRTVTETQAYYGFLWKGSRWWPHDEGDLANLEGDIEASEDYVEPFLEPYGWWRWYHLPIYSNDAYATMVTTGAAYNATYQYKLEIEYKDQRCGSTNTIRCPFSPYMVQDWGAAWAYPYGRGPSGYFWDGINPAP